MFRKSGLFFLLGVSLVIAGCGSDTVDIGNFSNLVQIVFATQPQNVNLGSSLPDIRIEGRDQFGQVINVSQGQVELRLGSNPTGASLVVNGVPVTSTNVSVQNGVATFSNVKVDKVGTGYTLNATYTAPNTTGSLSATSQSFNVNTAQVTSVFFLRSSQDLWDPLGGDADVASLDGAFGAGNWTRADFETANAAQIFQGNSRLVFMDGGSDGATAFANFLTANNTTITNFVQGGGRVILNAAPNVGGDIVTPFNATINYDGSTTFERQVTVDANHPIGVACNGTLQFTGSSFSHAHVLGNDLTPIITGSGMAVKVLAPADRAVLAEERVGSGLVLVGGMTTPNFHLPNPNSAQLRVNILRYAGGLPLIPAGAPLMKAAPTESSSQR